MWSSKRSILEMQSITFQWKCERDNLVISIIAWNGVVENFTTTFFVTIICEEKDQFLNRAIKNQLVNILTKPLKKIRFSMFKKDINKILNLKKLEIKS